MDDFQGAKFEFCINFRRREGCGLGAMCKFGVGPIDCQHICSNRHVHATQQQYELYHATGQLDLSDPELLRSVAYATGKEKMDGAPVCMVGFDT
jgi:hypothetical protein